MITSVNKAFHIFYVLIKFFIRYKIFGKALERIQNDSQVGFNLVSLYFIYHFFGSVPEITGTKLSFDA